MKFYLEPWGFLSALVSSWLEEISFATKARPNVLFSAGGLEDTKKPLSRAFWSVSGRRQSSSSATLGNSQESVMCLISPLNYKNTGNRDNYKEMTSRVLDLDGKSDLYSMLKK